MALLKAHRGQFDEAAETMQGVIAIEERTLKPGDLRLAQSLESYSGYLKKINQKAQARQAEGSGSGDSARGWIVTLSQDVAGVGFSDQSVGVVLEQKTVVHQADRSGADHGNVFLVGAVAFLKRQAGITGGQAFGLGLGERNIAAPRGHIRCLSRSRTR